MKNNMEVKSNKKSVILETAKQVFAEKGFDGSRMDEIAERAGVKKSLIYYHFEGKDHLLREILKNFFEEYEALLRSQSETDSKNDDKYMNFLDKNCDILRVILIESLKKNTKLTSIFQVVDMLMEYEKEFINKLNPVQHTFNHKRWVAEFFTSILPSTGFICYKDAWCSYFNVDEKTLENDYFEAYRETHGAYHRNKVISTQSGEDKI